MFSQMPICVCVCVQRGVYVSMVGMEGREELMHVGMFVLIQVHTCEHVKT